MRVKFAFLIIFCLFANKSLAIDRFKVDGIWYHVYSQSNVDGTTISKVEVVNDYENYSGDIVLPEKVTYEGFEYIVGAIGSSAFGYCSKLQSVKLPSSLEEIFPSAFMGSSSLTEIIIPKSVKYIGKNAFGGCDSLSSIIVEEGNIVFSTSKNINAIIHLDTLIAGCKTTIIPNGVKYISDYAFYNNNGLEKIEIPNSVEGIGKYAFSLCSNLCSLIIGSNSKLNSIDSKAFYYCDKLSDTPYSTCLEIIRDNCFHGCHSLTDVVIPKSVVYIGENVFGGCNSLSSIIVEKGNTVYTSLDNSNAIIHLDTLIAGCKNTIIPDGVKFINDYAFYNNGGLESIEIPNSVEDIGKYAFSLCYNLRNVIINSESSLKILDNNSFSMCYELAQMPFPSSLERIRDNSFRDCHSLTDVVIPKSVVYIGINVFGGCNSLSSIIVDEGNVVYTSLDNSNAIVHLDTLIAGCKTTIILDGIKFIDDYAFYNNDSLNYIEIPNSVKGIGKYAFSLCSNLKEVLSNIYEPFELAPNVFYGFKNANLYVPIGKIDEYEAKGWSKYFVTIEEITPNPTVSEDGLSFEIYQRREFAKLISMTQDNKHVVIPSSITYNGIDYPVKEISNSVFANSNIVTLSIPESINNVGAGIVANCFSLASIEWNANLKPSSEFVNNIINSNLLFYVKSSQNSPENVRNVIVGETAESIELTDEEYGDFYCPKTFVAKKISYTHNYNLKTQKGVCEGWESIALPFDVQTCMTSKGEVKPYKTANTGERIFWLRELTSFGLVEAEGIKANIPYIISMPNWDGYQDYYNINGDVEFSSQNVKIEATDIKAIDVAPRHFWPTFQNIDRASNYFALNKQHLVPSDTYLGDEHLPGSVFVGNLRDIKPFEAYFTYDGTSGAKVIKVSELLGETTLISNVEKNNSICINGTIVKYNSPQDCPIAIYTTTGQLVKKLFLSKGNNVVYGLSSGIYIVNGNKVFIE